MALASLTHKKLADDFGVGEEDDRDKIIYAIVDIRKKDSSHVSCC